MDKVLLVDGNNILHRAYHGLPLLRTTTGRYTNAVFGFLKMLHKVVEQEDPSYIAVCFDKGKQTFRHRLYPEYKAQRKPTDPELAEQFPLIREVLSLNGLRCLESDEYEADDLMGTLAKKAQKDGLEAVIFSGDKDLLQVLDEKITVVSGKKQLTDLKKMTEADFVETYGIVPIRLIDLKGLMGDSSDNYPGVKGIGEKTALKLLTTYETLEDLYDHIEDLPKHKMREKLEKDKESAFLSKKLATIETNVPLGLSWRELIPEEKKYDELLSLYRDLEFRGYVEELEKERGENDLFSDNLFENVTAERPFEMIRVSSFEDLNTTASLGLIFDGKCFYLADKEKNILSLSVGEDDETIASLLTDAKIKKVCADLKSIYHYGLARDLNIAGAEDDVVIAAYLDEANTSSYRPATLISMYLKINTALFEEESSFAEAALLPELAEILRHRLKEKNGLDLYFDVEMPLVFVLAEMEHNGVRADRKILDEMSAELNKKIETLAADINDLAGEAFNINSPKQMSRILFEKLSLPKGKKTRTGYSTSNDVLEKLRQSHPIVEKILEYRMVAKLKSTYTDVLADLISEEDGRIHPKFLQTVTTTGRLSCADPNLQNIPIRTEEGRMIRKAFIAADEEHLLLAADYSQIELRLLAHFSEDPVLIDSFKNREDVHRRTAGEIFGVPLEEVTSDMRRAAKTVNFGIIYGMSSFSLGNDLGVSRNQAQEYIDHYFARYPNVKNYLDGTIEFAREKGYAETLMGRRRHLPDIKNRNFNLRSFAERTAMNTPLQGSAADIIKLVMVRFNDALKEKGLKTKLILQVHDELIVDMPKEELDAVRSLMRQIMEESVTLRVPLTVDMKIGGDWYHMEKI